MASYGASTVNGIQMPQQLKFVKKKQTPPDMRLRPDQKDTQYFRWMAEMVSYR